MQKVSPETIARYPGIEADAAALESTCVRRFEHALSARAKQHMVSELPSTQLDRIDEAVMRSARTPDRPHVTSKIENIQTFNVSLQTHCMPFWD